MLKRHLFEENFTKSKEIRSTINKLIIITYWETNILSLRHLATSVSVTVLFEEIAKYSLLKRRS